ncbi:MAG: hypothetical protein HKN21_10810 [Candidatus Eisenbacteria bacterium]|uniref:Uncharacterized protein n=1 Tax=Eiseniibacteriota bacterium TaxID=2212470 RepID=A0A7Y2E9V1_UNCEI|nr:hypothetical protein [Candidatus Eisenbacteria bacterium]
MSRLSRAICVCAGVLFLVGCGSNVEFIRTDPTKYESTPSTTQIEVFQGPIVKPHVVIGVVTAVQEMKATTGTLSTYDEALRVLRVKARSVGGHALAELKPVYSDNAHVEPKVELTAKVVRFLEKEASISTQ